MEYNYTKVIWRNNKYVLQTKTTKYGKYKQIFASRIKRDVIAEREQLKKAYSLNPNYIDVRLDGLTYHKLMVITKQLNQKSCHKTMKNLIDKAHADCISSPHDH